MGSDHIWFCMCVLFISVFLYTSCGYEHARGQRIISGVSPYISLCLQQSLFLAAADPLRDFLVSASHLCVDTLG